MTEDEIEILRLREMATTDDQKEIQAKGEEFHARQIELRARLRELIAATEAGLDERLGRAAWASLKAEMLLLHDEQSAFIELMKADIEWFESRMGMTDDDERTGQDSRSKGR
jgi:hypothetical protein